MNYLNNYNEWLSKVTESEKGELLAIKDNDNEIKERFTSPLSFGTAGMRGIVGLGIGNLNIYTVMRATKGLCDYILTLGEEACKRGIIISYDTRRFSYEFALTVAKVCSANGINCKMFENIRPVPLCSFAVRNYNCVAGVMITASHNPKEYNGYKVYGEDGAQLSLEATEKVVEFINRIDDYFSVKMADLSIDRSDILQKDNHKINEHITIIGESLDELYYAELQKLSLSPKEVNEVCRDIKIVYTPIHGSGMIPVTSILEKMNIPVSVVSEQKDPDTEFSTVAVPNPEQPDALNLGIKLANSLGSDIVIGTDPDSDRMGVAIRNNQGEFILLTGNQIGALLMDYVLMRNKQNGTLPKNAAVIKTIVTTHLADNIAKNYGVTVIDVLTGFKFIGEKIKEWESNNKHTFMFGYEESFGYLCGTHARDKDAVVATMLFAEMACYYQSNKVTIYNKLQELFEKYGYFYEDTKNIAFKGLDGMEKMASIMEKFRNTKIDELAGIKIEHSSDLKTSIKTYANGKTEKVDLPKTNVLLYDLGNSQFMAIRPSGTEPKLKVYVSTVGSNSENAKQLNEKIHKALTALI